MRAHGPRLLPQRASSHPQTVGEAEVPQSVLLHPHGSGGPLCRHGGARDDGSRPPEVHHAAGKGDEVRRGRRVQP